MTLECQISFQTSTLAIFVFRLFRQTDLRPAHPGVYFLHGCFAGGRRPTLSAQTGRSPFIVTRKPERVSGK